MCPLSMPRKLIDLPLRVAGVALARQSRYVALART